MESDEHIHLVDTNRTRSYSSDSYPKHGSPVRYDTDDILVRRVRSRSSRKSYDKNRVVINVGGTRHETFFSTLRMHPNTRLSDITLSNRENKEEYDVVLQEYFYDRHPTAFTHIINFYRTGKLHAPEDICGPLFQEELEFWGLDEKSMEPCCWPKYTEDRDAQKKLEKFDTPLLNPIDEELNIETWYDQQVGRRDDGDHDNDHARTTNRFIQTVKHSILSSILCLEASEKRKKVWIAFEDRRGTRTNTSKAISYISTAFLALSIVSICFHSILFQYPDDPCIPLLIVADVLTFTWYTIEFSFRIWSSPKRWVFMKSLTNIADAISIITYMIQFFHKSGLFINAHPATQLVMSLRLLRLFRFLRLSLGFEVLRHVLITSYKEIGLLMLLVTIPAVIFATLTYYAERDVEGTKFKNIPTSIWWAIITVTTVGYGDMSPITIVGQMLGAACAICGIVVLSIPISIIGDNFTKFYSYAQARQNLPMHKKFALAGASNLILSSNNPDINATEGSKLPRRRQQNDPVSSPEISTSIDATTLFKRRERVGPLHVDDEGDDSSYRDSESEYEEAFKPIANQQSSTAMSFANKACRDHRLTSEIDDEFKGVTTHDSSSITRQSSIELDGEQSKHSIETRPAVDTFVTLSSETRAQITKNETYL